MATETLKTLVEFLAEHPQTLGEPESCQKMQVVETHISFVLLGERFAFKLKKPIDLGFVDYTRAQLRRDYCILEHSLNSRYSPEIYLQVLAFSGSPCSPNITIITSEDLSENCFEFAVQMNRFRKEDEFSQLLEMKLLTQKHIQELAETVGNAHLQFQSVENGSTFGSAETILQQMEQNFQQLQQLLGSKSFSGLENITQFLDELKKIEQWSYSSYERLEQTFSERQRQGFVKSCHGDLHLGNIVLFRSKVHLFDCIEFNDHLRFIDVMSDIAFLLMDLEDHAEYELSNVFLNTYLEITGDFDGLGLLLFYKVYRALIRAKVSLMTAVSMKDSSEQLVKFNGYINLCLEYISEKQPRILLTCGVSGSGKSFLAERLAKKIGAIHVKSDVERKRICGLKSLESSRKSDQPVQIGKGIYDPNMTLATYSRLSDIASKSIDTGFSVIVDATFLDPKYRSMFEQLSEQNPLYQFNILWCFADKDILFDRVNRRTNDASEANLSVLKSQLEQQDGDLSSSPLNPDEKQYLISVDTSHSIDLDRLCNMLH